MDDMGFDPSILNCLKHLGVGAGPVFRFPRPARCGWLRWIIGRFGFVRGGVVTLSELTQWNRIRQASQSRSVSGSSPDATDRQGSRVLPPRWNSPAHGLSADLRNPAAILLTS